MQFETVIWHKINLFSFFSCATRKSCNELRDFQSIKPSESIEFHALMRHTSARMFMGQKAK